MAGTKGKCPKCGATLRIPTSTSDTLSNAADETLTTNGRPQPARAALASAASSPASSTPAAGTPSVRPALDPVFRGSIDPVAVSPGYRMAVFFVAAYVVALALLYYCTVVAAFLAVGWFAFAGLDVFGEQGSLVDIVLYLTAVSLGLIGALLLAETILAPAARTGQTSVPVSASEEPLLTEFVQRIAREVHAAMPQRIELNCDIYVEAGPPKGWRAPFGKSLVLRIGLPLVEGLKLDEFGGLIAHELALFTRDSGKRRAYIIRSVSEWFQQIVTERDAWDLALLRASSRLGPVGGWLLLPLRTGIWVVRCVPWLFMVFAHGLSGVLMRQMELNADKYQTRLAGSDAFERACKRRVLLQYALRGAQSDLEMFRLAECLPDNLPKFVVATVAQQPAEVQQTVLDLIDRFRTGPLDPRPSDKQRIAVARAERAPGVLQNHLSPPALFVDFVQTARKVTRAYYTELFGSSLRNSAIKRVEELIDCQTMQEQASEARRRFFLDAFGPLRPVKLPAPQVHPPANLQLVQAQLQHQREQMRRMAEAYSADYSLYATADQQYVEASRAIALFKAGLEPKRELFSISFASLHQARDVRTSCNTNLDSLAAQLEGFEWSAGQRLHAALTLLHAPAFASLLEEVKARPGECERLLLVVSSVAGNLEDIHRLRTDQARLKAIVEHARGTTPGPAVMQELQRRTTRVYRELQAVHALFEHLEYPFPEESRSTVARHLLPTLPAANSLQGVMVKSQEFLDRLDSLYGRSVDRLCAMAERVEAAIDRQSTPDQTVGAQ